jgi:CheY-like chemotaxis protein
LVITRRLARAMGGDVQAHSKLGQGSTFTLYLPLVYSGTRGSRRPAQALDFRADVAVPGMKRTPPRPEPVVEDAVMAGEGEDGGAVLNEAGDDRDTIQQGDLVLLIVENDMAFASFLLDAARAKGFKGLVTSMGAGALTLATQYKPSAITLDMYLPDMEGWRVLDRIKQDMGARHLPVCVISTDDSKDRAFQSGAIAFVEKPIQSKEVLDDMLGKLHAYLARAQKTLLVALKDGTARRDFVAQMDDEQISAVVVKTADKLLEALEESRFDCVVLEDAFPGADSVECRRLLAGQAELGPLQLLIYRGGSKDAAKLSWQSGDTVTVQEAHSVPKLFDSALLALHHNLARLPEAKRSLINGIHESSKPLAGKRVLIVDDDMRNIFALATVLEEHGMDIVWADNGRDAISRVASDPQIKVILMDIMMPEMDGMATMKEIRKLPAGRNLPMIAVTAKAMKGDREKCIEAGAWDYLSKPVNTQDLLTVLRAWLHQ